MKDYEERMLTILVDKYRRSRKDSGTNVIVRRTKLAPSSLYKGYDRNDGDMEQIEAVNRAAIRCREMGFLTFDTESFSSQIRNIYLVDEKIEELECYLEKKYHYEPRNSKKRYVEGLIASYGGQSPASERECEKLRQVLKKNRIPQNYLQTEDLLKALVFIENNQKEIFLREASMLIYGDSKYLEENVLQPVCRALREQLDCPCEDDELEDEILEKYHIAREKQKLCLKGNIVLQKEGKELELGDFSDGVCFFSGEVEEIEHIHVRVREFITVENYTSWLRLRKEKAVLFYLGGYAVRGQRDFLKKVKEDNPQLIFRHFGDIDAGGFYIHEHLCRVTGIPFQMYRMSCAELQDPQFYSCLHPLTEQDRIRLKSLEKREAYRDVVAYMLEKNVKLEQEIISYYESE